MVNLVQIQRPLAFESDDFSTERPSLGLSGGINSAALLCYLATEHPEHKRPSHLLLYYAHLREHSPRTAEFTFECVRYARRMFPVVEFGMRRGSVVDFFEQDNFIPHPAYSPCTVHLKMDPMEKWSEAHGATVDLVGFVREERRRIVRSDSRNKGNPKRFPIVHMGEDDCFALVKREIGWYPPIYDLRDEAGKRLFTHNNCLPCKNMHLKQIRLVAEHFPKYWKRAEAMAQRINNYWGRPSEYPADPCATCVFD